jgi:hypothetical protein
MVFETGVYDDLYDQIWSEEDSSYKVVVELRWLAIWTSLVLDASECLFPFGWLPQDIRI